MWVARFLIRFAPKACIPIALEEFSLARRAAGDICGACSTVVGGRDQLVHETLHVQNQL